MKRKQCPYYTPTKQTCSNKNIFMKSRKAPVCQFREPKNCPYFQDWIKKHPLELKNVKSEPITSPKTRHRWLR